VVPGFLKFRIKGTMDVCITRTFQYRCCEHCYNIHAYYMHIYSLDVNVYAVYLLFVAHFVG